ncbi:hypothetical protein IWW37_001764 [Coemansia sp. RSA 2050]|nr:hypothetical protein IWW37_001764 [Coemansia sp. RSA 2050]
MAKRCAGAKQQASFFHTDTRPSSNSPSKCSPSSGAACAHAPTAARSSAWMRCTAILALMFVASPALAADSSTLFASTPTPTTAGSGSAITPVSTISSNTSSDVSSSSSSNSGGGGSSQSGSVEELEGDGGIGIVGAFSGVSSFSPTSSGSALSLNSTRTSLAALSQNSALLLASASANGPITAACAFYNKDGTISTAYIGGSFTTLNSTSVGYVAAVSATGQIDPMGGGVNGPVNALYCSQKSGIVYVGGNFTTVSASLTSSVATMRSNSTGALTLYSSATKTWLPLSFHGLNGPVFDFAEMDSKVYAVGAFSATVDNATHSALDSQPVNLNACTITGGNNAEIPGFSDPRNIICTPHADSSGNTWLMRDKLTGFYRIDFPFKTTPSLLRLMNTMYQDRGTKAIRIEAASTNQALTMSYLDPTTKSEQFCTHSCPVPQNYEWQEYRFVDNAATLSNISGIVINIVDWYGMGGGLNKIELYQRDPRVYADDRFSSSPCSRAPSRPSSSIAGDWKTTTPASYHGTYKTLTVAKADVSSAQAQSAHVRMLPYVPESGFYKIYMMVPGCQNTNTCLQRSSARVDLLMTRKRAVQTSVPQHNLADEEAVVYTGYIPASTQEFTMSISVGLDASGVVNPQAATIELVVDYFRLERVTSYTNLNGVIELASNLESPLYMDDPLYQPLNVSLPDNSIVYSATTGVFNDTHSNSTLFLGGRFSSPDSGYHNIAQYRNSKLKPLSNTGIWGTVYSMTFVNSSIYVGGNFNATADQATALSNVAQFNTTDQVWYPLSGGVDGAVSNVVPYSPFGPNVVAMSGSFQTLIAGPGSEGEAIAMHGLAMWDTAFGQWTYTPFIKGTLSMLFSDPWQNRANNVALVAGSLSAAAALKTEGALLLDAQQHIQPLGLLGSSLRPDDAGMLAVNTGLWYAKKNGTTAQLIVGGRFKTPDGSVNLARLKDGKWRGLLDGVSGEVLTINNAANLLFIGGVANVTESPSGHGDSNFGGLVVYNMDSHSSVGIQQLQGPGGSHYTVRVNKVAIRADTSMVVVGGNFSTAGGMLPCPYICTLDINENQWSPMASSSLVDQVTDLLFSGSTLYVAGTFQNGTSRPVYLMRYNFGSSSWDSVSGATALPGPITSLTPGISEAGVTAFYISGVAAPGGAPYLAKYDGSSVALADYTIGSSSTVRSILEVPRSRIPGSVIGSGSSSSLNRRSGATIPSGYVLVVSGDLDLPGGQRASNAFFYDNQWAPFLSTIQADGSPGFIGSVFFERPPTNVYQRHRLSVALVILIAIAIALGITFLIVLIGLVYIYLRNRREAAATASAASAALAATAGGAGTTKAPPSVAVFGGAGAGGTSDYARLGAGVGAAAVGGGAQAMRSQRTVQAEQYANGAGERDTWGDNAFAGEQVSFDNIAPKTDRLVSGQPAGLAGLAGVGRQAAVSSDTYVHYSDRKGDGKYLAGSASNDLNDSLDSIFESAAAEAEAEAEVEARERTASAGSMDAVVAGAAATAAAAAAAVAQQKIPAPRHYNESGNSIPNDQSSSGSTDYSRNSMYRPDSTNPFEQRLALRESQGTFPPAGPYADGADGLGHVPMPRAHHMESEHAAAAALAGATVATSKAGGKGSRRRSETASTRNTEAGLSPSQSPSSRPSGESSVNGSSTHLPIRDSLRQYPVFYAKFTFSSRETGELGFRAGERVFVIDQSDEIWWMGIADHGSDQPLEQGVFPATYVSGAPPESTDWAELV